MNKKLIVVIVFIIAIISVTAEKIEDTPIVGYVNDYANIISSEDETQINLILKQLAFSKIDFLKWMKSSYMQQQKN